MEGHAQAVPAGSDCEAPLNAVVDGLVAGSCDQGGRLLYETVCDCRGPHLMGPSAVGSIWGIVLLRSRNIDLPLVRSATHLLPLVLPTPSKGTRLYQYMYPRFPVRTRPFPSAGSSAARDLASTRDPALLHLELHSASFIAEPLSPALRHSPLRNRFPQLASPRGSAFNLTGESSDLGKLCAGHRETLSLLLSERLAALASRASVNAPQR